MESSIGDSSECGFLSLYIRDQVFFFFCSHQYFSKNDMVIYCLEGAEGLFEVSFSASDFSCEYLLRYLSPDCWFRAAELFGGPFV